VKGNPVDLAFQLEMDLGPENVRMGLASNRFAHLCGFSGMLLWTDLPRLAKNWISLVVARNQVLHMQQCL